MYFKNAFYVFQKYNDYFVIGCLITFSWVWTNNKTLINQTNLLSAVHFITQNMIGWYWLSCMMVTIFKIGHSRVLLPVDCVVIKCSWNFEDLNIVDIAKFTITISEENYTLRFTETLYKLWYCKKLITSLFVEFK